MVRLVLLGKIRVSSNGLAEVRLVRIGQASYSCKTFNI